MYSYQYGSLMQNQNAYEQNLKNIINQANSQLQQLQNQPVQVAPQPTNLTQNFQLAPTSNNNELEAKYANSIDEVTNTLVIKTGIFINKTFDTLWIKNVNGDIRTFTLNEIIETDPRDQEIYLLRKQIEEMKGMITNANESNSTNANEQITEAKPTRVSSSKRTNAK